MVWCTIMRAWQVFRYQGDHRHYGDREVSYRFESLDKLLEDFREDCTRLAGWRWR